MAIKRVVAVARSHAEADRMDVLEQVSLTPEQRWRIARSLKRRAYGSDPPDVRRSERGRP